MNRAEIRAKVQTIIKKIAAIAGKKVMSLVMEFFNLVESLVEEIEKLHKTVQDLKNEICRLKGEKGKPHFLNKKKNDDVKSNHSSEKERKDIERLAHPRQKKQKKNIKIDRQVVCKVDKKELPSDAEFKGYETIIKQDIKIVTDNVEFKREVYYSASLKKTFTAKLPPGYFGGYGPGLRSLALCLYNDSGVTELPIERFLKMSGIQISKATVSRMITDNHEVFHKEKEDIIWSGLRSTSYQHIDDTKAVENGKHFHAHILCNDYYTAFTTLPSKDRLTVLSILCCGELKFSLNEKAYEHMFEHGLYKMYLSKIKQFGIRENLTRAEIDKILAEVFPDAKRNKRRRRLVLEASAITYYQGLDHAIKQLVCDEAAQFDKLTENRSLCWVHALRHFKKLNPVIDYNIKQLDAFTEKSWDLYRKLYSYKKDPTNEHKKIILDEFDELFSTKTGYESLDKLIAKTRQKKEWLLLALKFPFLPLHNNPAELGARVQARKRDINLQTKNEKGTRAKDTFATIVQTAKKLQVNIFDYIYDRISGSFEMPSLADLITQKSQTLSNFNTS